MNPRRWPIIVDTREQRPLPLAEVIAATGLPFTVKIATMPTGDYCIEGLESVCMIERKSLPDLVACCTGWRPRFESELERMKNTTQIPVLLIEADLGDVLEHRYRSAAVPASILGSLSAWSIDYSLRIWWAGSPEGGATMLLRFFAAIARRVERGELGAVAG